MFDGTLLLTPSAKFNAYINYEQGQNRDAAVTTCAITTGDTNLNHWQGATIAAHGQITGKSAFAVRNECFNDPNGFETGTAQHVLEFTGTYEYKWIEGLMARLEYRGDFSNVASFHKDKTAMTDSQSTVTLGLVAFFGPKR